MVDTGWGSTLRLYQAAMPPQTIDAVFITHLHSDHTTDLADFLVMRWVGGIRGPIPIYGPVGTSRMVKGFQEAMAADTKYRLDHHGDKLWSGGLAADVTEIEAGDEPVEVADIGGISVKAFEVDHFPVKPAYGYRFEKDGRSIAISGDTNPCPGLLNRFEGRGHHGLRFDESRDDDGAREAATLDGQRHPGVDARGRAQLPRADRGDGGDRCSRRASSTS